MHINVLKVEALLTNLQGLLSSGDVSLSVPLIDIAVKGDKQRIRVSLRQHGSIWNYSDTYV